MKKEDAIKLLQIGKKQTLVGSTTLWVGKMYLDEEGKGDPKQVVNQYLQQSGIADTETVNKAARSLTGGREAPGLSSASLVFNLSDIEQAAGMSFEQAKQRKPAAERPGAEAVRS